MSPASIGLSPGTYANRRIDARDKRKEIGETTSLRRKQKGGAICYVQCRAVAHLIVVHVQVAPDKVSRTTMRQQAQGVTDE